MATAASKEPKPRTRARLCGPLGLELEGVDVARGLPGGQPTVLLGYLLASPRSGRRSRRADRRAVAREPATRSAERPATDSVAPPSGCRARRDRGSRAASTPATRSRVARRRSGDQLRSKRLAPRPGVDSGTTCGSTRRPAIGLLRPGFLAGLQGDWVEVRRRELDELLLEALELLSRGAVAVARPDLGAAERASRELIARSPYRETGYRFLMEALAASGNVAEALARLRRPARAAA